MEYNLFGGADYLYAGKQMGGKHPTYQSGWKSGIPKKPGYKLAKVNGTPKYIKKKGRFPTGYQVFWSEYSKKNPRTEGPSLAKAVGKAWKKLSKKEHDRYVAKGRAMGKRIHPGPPTRDVAKAHLDKLKGNRRSRTTSRRSSRKSSSRRRSARKNSSRRRSARKSSSRRRSASRSMTGTGYGTDDDDDDYGTDDENYGFFY